MNYFIRFSNIEKICISSIIIIERICISSIPKRVFVNCARSYCGVKQEIKGTGSLWNTFQERWCREYMSNRNDLKIQKWEF